MDTLGKDIFKELINSKEPMTISDLQKDLGTGFGTVKKYVNFIRYVQDMPRVKVIAKSKGTTFVGLEKDTIAEDVEFARELYPKPSRDLQILVRIKHAGDVLFDSFAETDKAVVKELEKNRDITIEKGRIKLTPLGKEIARGAEIIYNC